MRRFREHPGCLYTSAREPLGWLCELEVESKIRTEERALRAYQHRESLLHLGAMSVSQVGAAVQYALAEGDADSLGLLLMELGRRVGLDVSVRRQSGRAEGVETDSFRAATAPVASSGRPTQSTRRRSPRR